MNTCIVHVKMIIEQRPSPGPTVDLLHSVHFMICFQLQDYRHTYFPVCVRNITLSSIFTLEVSYLKLLLKTEQTYQNGYLIGQFGFSKILAVLHRPANGVKQSILVYFHHTQN